MFRAVEFARIPLRPLNCLFIIENRGGPRMSAELSLLRALSFCYWGRHHVRAALLLACLGLGIATWNATRALELGLEQAGQQTVAPLQDGADLSLSNDDVGVPRHWADEIRCLPGVAHVRPITVKRVRISRPAPASAMLLGLDLMNEKSRAANDEIDAATIACFAQAKLRGEIPVLAGRRLAEQCRNASPCCEIWIDGRTTEVTIAGAIPDDGRGDPVLDGSVLLMDLADLERITGQADSVSRLDVLLGANADKAQAQSEIERIAGGAAHVRTSETSAARSNQILSALQVAFSLCGLGALVAGLLLIHNVLAVSVVERTGMTGILRSMGATRGQIFAGFALEAAAFGALGSLLGLPLGYGLSRLAAGPMQQIVSETFLPLAGTKPAYSWWVLAGGVAAGLATALLAAAVPAARAARVSPKEALRRLQPAVAKVAFNKSVGLAALFALIGVVVSIGLPHWHGRIWTSVLMITLAGLCFTPWLAVTLARVVRVALRPWLGLSARLALDGLIRRPKRHALALVTLAGGLALLLQTGALIRSNEEAAADWLDRSVVGDLFVTSGSPLSASGENLPMTEGVGEQCRSALPGSHVVPFRFRYLDWAQGNHADRILLVLLDAAVYRATIDDRYPQLPDRDLYRQLSEQPDGVLVSRNFAALHGFKPGDKLFLQARSGNLAFLVLGTVADYSCARGTILLDRNRYGAAFDCGLVDVFSITVPTGNGTEEARGRLRQSAALEGNGLFILTHDELRRHALNMIRRLYGVAAAQLGVILVVSILGVATTMLISVLQQRGEMSMLRSLGATRGQIVKLVLTEAVFVGLLGSLLGVMFGLPLAWYTEKFALLAETGFVFPFAIPWSEAALVALLAIVCSASAALWPALRASRWNPAECLMAD
jgi:putative ABC transport system permease protein